MDMTMKRRKGKNENTFKNDDGNKWTELSEWIQGRRKAQWSKWVKYDEYVSRWRKNKKRKEASKERQSFKSQRRNHKNDKHNPEVINNVQDNAKETAQQRQSPNSKYAPQGQTRRKRATTQMLGEKLIGKEKIKELTIDHTFCCESTTTESADHLTGNWCFY